MAEVADQEYAQLPASTIRSELEQELYRIIENARPVDLLDRAIKHALFPPGKLIRPLLCLSFCSDLGGDYRPLLPVASALELLHTSSLIHDDLPAMDDDDMRRGRPSCHKVFGEATAILAGDYLVALAHHMLIKNSYPPQVRADFVDILSQTYLKLCDGQQLDLLGSKNRDEITRIHLLKTAALFSATLMFGALGAGLEPERVRAAGELGTSLGLSFQIIDDYIDLFSNEKGREGGSDSKNNKTTFLNVITKESLQAEVKTKRNELREQFELFSGNLEKHSKKHSFSFPLSWPIVEGVFSKI